MRTLLIGSAMLFVLAAGCKKPAENTPAAGTSDFKVGLVADESGINDQSFNASAWRGLQNAEKELGVKVLPSESREQSDFTRNLRSFAKQGYDIVFASGFSMQDAMKLVAAEYPDTKFVIIDGDNPGTPNTASIKFKEHEAHSWPVSWRGEWLSRGLSALSAVSTTGDHAVSSAATRPAR